MRKIKLIYLQSSKEDWLVLIQKLYLKKINHFIKFEIEFIKTKSIARENKIEKISKERDLILRKINQNDFLILLDEQGKVFKHSRDFSKFLQEKIENDRRNLVFIIGGSYGLHQDLKAKSDMTFSLSNLTMNHHIAQIVLLEQIYRGFAIIKNLPYHND